MSRAAELAPDPAPYTERDHQRNDSAYERSLRRERKRDTGAPGPGEPRTTPAACPRRPAPPQCRCDLCNGPAWRARQLQTAAAAPRGNRR
jgi:hypothetical protein